MRPERLTIEGLTCFKDKQELDLRELELFAIAGPTGAGKSTLLDAMVLALYGEIPRVGKQGRSEMISSSRDRASVVLDFAVGPDRYRIARTLRRTGASQVRLEKHDGQDFNISLADQIRLVGPEIEKILGLNAEAFTQSVLLPQGEFARFLKAEPKVRREMLCTLLRLGVYDQMREHAQRVFTATKASVETTRKILREEYVGVTPAALEALGARHAQLSAVLVGARQRRDEARRTCETQRVQRGLTSELAGCETSQRGLVERGPQIEQARTRLEAARRAAPVAPLLEEARRGEITAVALAAQAESARGIAEAAQQRQMEQEHAVAAAEQAAAEIPTLRQLESRLHQAIGQLPEIEQLEQRTRRRRTECELLATELGTLETAIEEARAAQTAEATELEAAREIVLGCGYDEELDTRLQPLRDAAVKLGLSRSGAADSSLAEASKRQALRGLQERLRALEGQEREAEAVAEGMRQAAQLAEVAVHTAHRLDAASYLRGELRPHQPCPVCEQLVGSVPAIEMAPEVSAAEAAHQKAKEALAKAEGELQQARSSVIGLQGRVRGEEAVVAELAERAQALAAHVKREEGALRAELGTIRIDAPVETWIETRIKSLAEQRRTHERAQKRIEKAERAIERASADQRAAAVRFTEKTQQRMQLEEELSQSLARLGLLRTAVENVARSKDPADEATKLATQIEALEAARKHASIAASESALRSSSATEARRSSAEAAAQAHKAAEAGRQRRDEELRQRGFVDDAAVLAALQPEPAQAEAEEQIRSYEQELYGVKARIGTLRDELGETRVSSAELEEVERHAQKLGVAVEQQHGEQKTLEGQVERMRERLERSISMHAKLETDEQTLALYRRLADDLRSDKFQTYLLEEAFQELVRGASLRLLELTAERYALRFKDGDILVIDNDNAGEARISDTLSGGETFLTSLALALELSEHVQRSVGAVRLDSLFIDEGFGTLDPDTLALVSDAIQRLRVGGRMVGIITHLPELRDDLAQQILVTKHQGYSTVEVRAGTSLGDRAATPG